MLPLLLQEYCFKILELIDWLVPKTWFEEVHLFIWLIDSFFQSLTMKHLFFIFITTSKSANFLTHFVVHVSFILLYKKEMNYTIILWSVFFLGYASRLKKGFFCCVPTFKKFSLFKCVLFKKKSVYCPQF